MRPTLWLGMPSYGLQLAAGAERQGFDLASTGVRRLVCAAELLTQAKRQKLEALWGAEVYDHFGCAEGGPLGTESNAHDGFHLFEDLFFFEVVDERDFRPLAPGKTGVLLMTPLYTNTVTPFLRWNMGDLGTLAPPDAGAGDLSLFPVFRHAGRTTGFFKVRGVNINHADFEDFMHRRAAVLDFRVAAAARETSDELRVEVELRRDCDREAELRALAAAIRATFEVTPAITLVEDGALARVFAEDLKAKRFVDTR
jgi:phenylacetate-CoA ligase